MKPTQEQVIAWAREAGFVRTKMHGALERFATLAYEAGRRDENEECAKALDAIAEMIRTVSHETFVFKTVTECAAVIRARREQ